MADIQIAITAKNDAAAALAQVNADLANLAKTAQATSTTLESIGRTQLSLGTASNSIQTVITGLQAATKEAEQYKRVLSEPVRVQNAGGVENVTASIKAARAELTALLKQYQELAKQGKLDYGEGTAANLVKAQTAITQQLALLKQVETAAKAAAKAGVLGDGNAPSAQIAQVSRTANLLTQALKGTESQANKTKSAVENVGKGSAAGLSTLKNELAGVDKAFGNLNSVLGGGLGGVAGIVGLGATAAAIAGIGSAINDAVLAADRVDKLKFSFDNLAASAGQSGDEMLNSLRAASRGMVTDADLIVSANKAMMLGVADNAQEMTALLDIARARGQAMGLDMTQAFNDIVVGLGRGSALILDNLGITVDAATANQAYAASIGKVVSQLTEQEKKQALINAVMEQSKNITAGGGSGAGTAAQQAQVAAANAQVAAGEFFAAPVRDAWQAYIDFIDLSTGKLDQAARAQRELNDSIADQKIVIGAQEIELGPEQVERRKQLAQANEELNRAQAAGVPLAAQYADKLAEYTDLANKGVALTQQQANTAQLAADGLRQEVEVYTALQGSVNALAATYPGAIAAQRQMATAEEQAAAQAVLAKYSVDALGTSMSTAAAMAQAMAGGLSQVQAQAGATAGVIYNLAAAQQALAAASNKNLSQPDALDRVLPQINSIGGSLVDNLGLDGAIAKTNELKIANRDLYETLQAQGYTEDQIYLALSANVSETQKWASSLDGVSDATAKAQEQFENIQSKVAGLIQQAQTLPTFKASDLFNADELTAKGLTGDSQISIDQAANGGLRLDEINENARRLMAIAKEGLTDQPWLEEFKREVPAVFAELQNNPDIRGAALNILKQFQDGMRPELLDQGMIKDRVKAMILGEQNAAQLAQQIAQEIASEMGISLQQAMQATNATLGIGTGDGENGSNVQAPDMTAQGTQAGESLRVGMIAGFDAAGMTVAILAKIDAEFSNPKSIEAVKKSGGSVGAIWGTGFLSTVGQNIPPGLYDVLVGGLVPLIVAAIGAQGSRTGAQP